MKTSIMGVAVLMLAQGCSHVPPKTETVAKMEAPAKAPTPHPFVARAPEATPTPTPGPPNKVDPAIYFDFDSALLRDESRAVLQRLGSAVKSSHKSVLIEGNCDERGTTEFNLALGDHRAREAMRYLERLGVPDNRLSVVSFGSERPKNPKHDEQAYAENRRDDLIIR